MLQKQPDMTNVLISGIAILQNAWAAFTEMIQISVQYSTMSS